MGQRHQVFIHMPSPLHKLEANYKSAKKYNAKKEELDGMNFQIELYKNAFGKRTYTNGCWHHQWLYGRSALLAALNILHLNTNTSDSSSNPFSIDTCYHGDDLLNLITHTLGLFNNKLACQIGRCGVEKFHFMNFSEPKIRTDCKNCSDNNDGITIIDTTKNAYAFVNIGIGDSTVSQLPEMEPSSAEQYVRIYYPQCMEDSSTVKLPEDLVEREKYFNSNIRLNRIFIRQFQPYRLLTKNEIKKLFPGSFKQSVRSNEQNR